ncbi:MAG: hypothetical protein KC931_01285 [Candidatus Omnitrophica bacterium]|nr:hypothetical protein [Candidatus Omnitrophota bacterium]
MSLYKRGYMNGAIVVDDVAKAKRTPMKTRIATTGTSQNFFWYFRNSQYSVRMVWRLIL